MKRDVDSDKTDENEQKVEVIHRKMRGNMLGYKMSKRVLEYWLTFIIILMTIIVTLKNFLTNISLISSAR